MTTPSSAFPQGTRDNFDTGPLSWVMGEIREALTRSKASLQEALGQDAENQSTALRHAKTYLHQAHGALQIVDVDGVAIITETVEDLLDRLESAQLALTPEVAQGIENAYQALIEYLEELLSGAPHQPVRLFPYYRALLQVRGAERIHPADLFFPNLAIRPHLPPAEPLAAQVDYVALRKRFEKALLPFLRSTDHKAELASAAAMRELIDEVERAQANQQSRGFWWVMHGFAEAVAAGEVPNELYVKQLFARINLQIRRLSEGSTSIAERLLRDALFFIARAENPTPRVRQIRAAYQLDGQVPADYEKKRYGQVDVEALANAKERLSHAKNMWNRIAGGDPSAAQPFEHEMHGLTEAGAKLNAPPLSKLLRELNGIARHAAHASPADKLGMELATSLLFVENALNHISHLPDNFAERADAMTARLLSIVSGEQPVESAQWLDDMSREAQQRQTMLALAGEMQSSLRQVEKMLDEYFNDPAQRASLAQIDTVLHQIAGAMAILDQDDAMRAVQHTQAAVRRFAEAEEIPELHEFQHVAQNVGALSFFIETLQLHSDGVKKRFSFDDKLGVFHANLLEKPVDSTAPIDVEIAQAPVSDSPADVEPEPVVEDLPTVEEDLAFHQQHAAELAISLTAEPDNSELQEQLKESLEQVRLDATLVDNPEANDRAQAAIAMLDRPDFVASQDALAEIVIATSPAVPTPVVSEPAAPAPVTDEAVDAELLEIFLSEAVEVLDCVKQTVPSSRNEPYNQDHLTTLRRSFHTLKGSGRMVGLMAFGEAAWSIEQVLNVRLSETRGGDADLYALLDKAVEVLSAWVDDLQTHGRSARTPAPLVATAERIKVGGGFLFEDAAALIPVPAPIEVVVQAPSAVIDEAEIAPDASNIIDPSAFAPGEATDLASMLAAHIPAAEHTDEAEASAASALTDAAEPAPAHGLDAPFEFDLDIPSDLPQVEEVQLSDADMAAFAHGDLALAASAEPVAAPVEPQTSVASAEVIDFPSMAQSEVKLDDNVKRIGDLEISLPLHNIYLAETDELVRLLSQDIAEWRHEPDRHVNIQAVHAAHSLAGSSATVGFKPLQEIAHALEMTLQYLARKPAKLTPHEYDTLEHGIDRIRFMLQMFALGEMPDHEPEQVQILERIPREIEGRSGAKLDDAFYAPVMSLDETSVDAPSPESAHHAPVIESVAAVEVPNIDLSPLAGPTTEELDALLAGAPGSEAPSESSPQAPIEMASMDFAEPSAIAEPARDELTLDEGRESAAILEFPVAEDVPMHLAAQAEAEVQAPEALLDEMPDGILEGAQAEIPDVVQAAAPDVVAETSHEEVQIQERPQETIAQAPLQPSMQYVSAPVQTVIPEPVTNVPFAEPVFARDNEAAPESALKIKDELDADLMPVFLEEGRDMLPQMGQALRAWQQKPDDTVSPQSLLRHLHTIKGSARMAGAMRLGQHMHEMETRIEQIMRLGVPSAQALDDLLARHDHGLHLFEVIQNPQAAEPVAPAFVASELAAAQEDAPAADRTDDKPGLVELRSVMPAKTGSVAAPAMPAAKAAVPAAAVPLVRVRADILDRLVNQAGEVSISRSKLETEVGTLRLSLGELTENVARLRDQLREIEMQAETQITSRMAHSGDREFDPLEFDRFTRLQELTRMMAESVNDVSSVQQNLARTVDNANTDLTMQARLTRDLQQDLMRVRMIQFASISERLYRVTRQASKEVDKRVNLDIRGSAVEIDRSVLEKMAGPFEHLLRNAIVHGIETRDGRRAAGKNETGELLVEIRQEGNEVVIQFSDDGQGLNLANIRNKAKSTGLLTDDTELSDAEVTDLIFHPGFSTAEQVTELAGRGVGMDVVRSEAAALGGRVAIVSEPGKGAHFTISLPLTLAVTQAVILTTGGKTYAVPSVLVEQVQQLKTNPLAAAYNDGAVMWQGNRVPLHYLSALLGDTGAAPVAQQYSPIMILKSGNDRVAVHVDEILGNREVVVKNIGPQLARMIGIAGATVLGSGEIVLILNPVPLAHRFAHESVRAPRLTPSDAPQQMGAVAEMATTQVTTHAAGPIQGLRTQTIVMVVDDSLTVRRVTQRLLAREGYQVVLAKDGVDALEHLQSITPDVMLVDIEMPRMDGFDLTRNIRSDERTRHIPIIMITSRTATKHRNYAMELGVNEYLGKPYQEDALLKSIAGFVHKETPVT